MPHLPLAFAIICGTLVLLGSGEGAKPKCASGQYQSSALVLNCRGEGGTLPLNLAAGQLLSVGSFPSGTPDVSIALSTDVAADVELLDSKTGTCVAGHPLERPGSARCLHTECVSRQLEQMDDYCLSYSGMPMYWDSRRFSGDDGVPPVEEKMQINGIMTRSMDFAVLARAAGVGTVTYSYGALSPCPDLMPGCSPCKIYSGCGLNGTPVCDGTASVKCAGPTPTTTPLAVPPCATVPASATSPPGSTLSRMVSIAKAARTSTTPNVASPCSPIADPATSGTNTKRPNLISQVLRNMSAGTRVVGGLIQHQMDNDVAKLHRTVDNAHAKLNNTLNKVRKTIVNGLERGEHAVENFEHKEETRITNFEHQLPRPTFPPNWRAKVTFPPSWHGIIGKEQAMNTTFDDKSKNPAPMILSSWLASLFSSWNASVFVVLVLALLLVLFSVTSWRCCVVVTRKLRGYTKVSLPSAAPCQSRDVFLTREIHLDDESLFLESRGDGLGMHCLRDDSRPGASRTHLMSVIE